MTKLPKIWVTTVVLDGEPSVELYTGPIKKVLEQVHSDLAGPMLDDDTDLKALGIRTIKQFVEHWAEAMDVTIVQQKVNQL